MRLAIAIVLRFFHAVGTALDISVGILAWALLAVVSSPFLYGEYLLIRYERGFFAWACGAILFFILAPAFIELIQLLPYVPLSRGAGSGTSRLATPRSLRRKGLM